MQLDEKQLYQEAQGGKSSPEHALLLRFNVYYLLPPWVVVGGS